MKFLQSIFNFYINSSIHVALAVYSLARITEKYFHLPYNEIINYVLFYGTITGYNFIKYAGIAKLHHRSLTKNLKIIQVFSLLCFLLLIYYASKLTPILLSSFFVLGMCTVFYALPIFGASRSLRELPTIKIWIIALIWALSTTVIPVLAANQFVDTKLVFLTIQRFLFVVVLTLPFDIRDLQFDKRALRTLPQILGVARIKKLGFVFLGIIMLIEFFVSPDKQHKTIFILVFLGMLFLLQRAKVKQPKYYASFWVEAIPIFWFFLLSLIVNK